MSDDRLQKLRDLGANVRLGREGETVALFGFRRVPKADESQKDGASSPSDSDAPSLTPQQQALKMRATYDPKNSIDASAWLGEVHRED